MNKKVSTILVGVSGEYFVAAELSRRGYIASITLRNTKGIDIVASSENGDKTVNIQVKTKSKGKWWLLSKKAETIKDKNIIKSKYRHYVTICQLKLAIYGSYVI